MSVLMDLAFLELLLPEKNMVLEEDEEMLRLEEDNGGDWMYNPFRAPLLADRTRVPKAYMKSLDALHEFIGVAGYMYRGTGKVVRTIVVCFEHDVPTKDGSVEYQLCRAKKTKQARTFKPQFEELTGMRVLTQFADDTLTPYEQALMPLLGQRAWNPVIPFEHAKALAHNYTMMIYPIGKVDLLDRLWSSRPSSEHLMP